MTVNEAIEELKAYAELGYGEKPLFLFDTLSMMYVQADDISPVSDGSGIEVSHDG